MARPSEEFLLAWSSLSCETNVTGWQVISLPSAGPVEVKAGRRSPDNAEAVLLHFPTAQLARTERLPEGRGFIVEKADSTTDEGLKLAMTRQEAGSEDLFAAMSCDVVGAIDNAVASGASESKLLRIFIGRVFAWQQFMSRGAAPLSLEAELGLIGELSFMVLLLESGAPMDMTLNGWVGPDDAPQDFMLGDGAIEVKATMSSASLSVKIGSLEQLDDSVVSPLFLAALRFSRDGEGLTLPEIILKLEKLLQGDAGAISFFRQKLLVAGYSETHISQYTRKFAFKECRIFSISESFPRLTHGLVTLGVIKALYEINLDNAHNYLTDLDAALIQLGVTG